MIDFENLTRCPLCGDTLLNEYTHGNNLSKGCKKRVDHYWEFVEIDPFWKDPLAQRFRGVETYLDIKIDMQKQIFIRWFLPNKEVWVFRGDSILQLPWIDPNFVDYRKFVKKLRTLVVFS